MSDPQNYREASKWNWHTTSGSYSYEHIAIGSLQRIADATEVMAKNYLALQADCDRYKRYWNEELERREQRDATITGLRGRITRLKRQLKAQAVP